MIESIIHGVRDFFKAIFKIHFGDYNHLQSAVAFRNFTLDILKVTEKFLLLILLFIIGEQLIFFWKYFNSDLRNYIHFYDGLSFNLIIVIALTLTLPAYHFCHYGIKRINKALRLENFYFENHKLQIDKIFTQTLSIGNKISKNHDISFSFFSSIANEQNNYVEFIELIQKTTHLQPQELTSIAEIAKKSTYGHFMCVIAYLDFFKNENEFKEMINYFSKWEIVASEKKNIVQRIFTIPGIEKQNPSEDCYKTMWNNGTNKINNFYLYCYLVLNKICSCDTYLLIYDNTKRKSLSNRFLIDVDYVLAFKNENSCETMEDNVELYFAYPEEGELNRTLKLNDSYFIRMFELDFKKRMKLDPSDETPTTLFDFSLGNIEKILKMLHIDRNNSDDRNKLNQNLDLVKNLLLNNTLFNQKVLKRIDEWKIKKKS